jgi:hypothetical protein
MMRKATVGIGAAAGVCELRDVQGGPGVGQNLNILLHSINSEGRVNTIDGKTFTLDGLCNNCFYNSETKAGGCTKMFCMGGVMELEAFVFDLLKNASNLLDLNTANGIKQGAKLVNNDKWVILMWAPAKATN